MNTPRTLSGKLCKLCIAKGGPCHLHKTKTDKKSSKKLSKSPKKMNLEMIPLPALQKILLQVPRKNLSYFCVKSAQASKLCKLERFRKLYDERHPRLIRGKLTLISHNIEDERIEMRDDTDNRFVIAYSIDRNKPSQKMVDEVYYYHNRNSKLYSIFYLLGSWDRASRAQQVSIQNPKGKNPLDDVPELEDWFDDLTLTDSGLKSLILYNISKKGTNSLWKYIQKHAAEVVPPVKEMKLTPDMFGGTQR